MPPCALSATTRIVAYMRLNRSRMIFIQALQFKQSWMVLRGNENAPRKLPIVDMLQYMLKW
jgi:hypothetical protein